MTSESFALMTERTRIPRSKGLCDDAPVARSRVIAKERVTGEIVQRHAFTACKRVAVRNDQAAGQRITLQEEQRRSLRRRIGADTEFGIAALHDSAMPFASTCSSWKSTFG